MVEIQQLMINNTLVPECGICMKREADKIFSERQLHNKEWFKIYDDIQDFINSPEILYYDLRYSNLCNLRCQTCGPGASSAWAEQLGLDNKFLSWEPEIEINPNARKIYLAGGEPFMIKSFSKALNGFANKDCEIIINTNATIITDHMMDALKPFTNICFTLSIDGIGKVNDQIRTGSDWDTIVKNIETMKFHGKHRPSKR